MSADAATATPSLAQVRARIDAIDSELLRLIDERSGLAKQVAAAKAAEGAAGKFALRPAREAEVVRHLLAKPRAAASASLVVKVWRELIGDSLSRQGPYHVSVFGGRDPGRATELARMQFGAAPPVVQAAKAEDALTSARTPGGIAVLSLASDTPWWGRLLAEPKVRVFNALPCLAAWGPVAALACADVPVEPTGADKTFWVTDARESATAIASALSRDGAAATLLADAGGLKLFCLAGFYQAEDERLSRAPGRLKGVIGAAPAPFDV